jgi:hypothetical protein
VRDLTITATDLYAVGVPLSLSHLLTLPHQHSQIADCVTCREWNGRAVTVRSGHTFKLGLLHIQARELRDYVERVSALNEEDAVLESLVFAAAVTAAPVWIEVAKVSAERAEREASFTKRDSYYYERRAADIRAEVCALETMLGDLLYAEAVKAAPVAVKAAA